MNRVEFQKWLDQFPEDTDIECLMASESGGHWNICTVVQSESFKGIVEFNGLEEFGSIDGKDFSYRDWSKNQFVKPGNSYYNKKILQIGMEK